MPFKTLAQISTQLDAVYSTAHVYKPVTPLNSVSLWVDNSMCSGTPIYNAYVGSQLDSTALVGSKNIGIRTGQSSNALLTSAMFQTRSVITPVYTLTSDYLMFYPLIDGNSTDTQVCTQTDTIPRYPTGDGVQCMVVCTLPSLASSSCTITYTNQAGVANRTSTFVVRQGLTVGSICSSQSAAGSASPFIPMQGGDTGFRSIQDITLTTAVDGFFCFVLIKPLVPVTIFEVDTPSEVSFISQRLSSPRVFPGAYINFISRNSAATAGNFIAQLTFCQEI